MKAIFNFIYNTHRKIILYAIFVLFLLANIFQHSTLISIQFFNIFFGVIMNFCESILALYFLVDLITRKFSLTPFLLIGGICAFATVFFSHRVMLCFLFAFLYVFKDYKFKEIAKVFAITVLIGLGTVILLSATGIINNNIDARGTIHRVCLGFSWSVPAITFYMFSVMAYNYVRGGKITYFELIIELAINYLLFYFTNTRTGYFLTTGIIVIMLILKFLSAPKVKKKFLNCKPIVKVKDFFSQEPKNKICAILFACIPLLCVAVFGILVGLYGTGANFILKVDSILSGRLELTYDAFLTRKITPFGGIYNWVIDGKYVGVDSAFYHYLFNAGVFPTLFILFFTIFLFYKSFREKNYYLSLILVFTVGSAFIDIFYWNIGYNVFLLALAEGDTGRKILFGCEKPYVNDMKPSVQNNEGVSQENGTVH